MILCCLKTVPASPGKNLPLDWWEICRAFKFEVEKAPVLLRTRLLWGMGADQVLSLAKSQMKTVSKFQMIPTKTVFTQMNKASLCDGLVQLLRLSQEQCKWYSVHRWLPRAPSHWNHSKPLPATETTVENTYTMTQPQSQCWRYGLANETL